MVREPANEPEKEGTVVVVVKVAKP